MNTLFLDLFFMLTTTNKPLIKLYEVELTSNVEISPNVFLLKFKRFFEFNPGQVIAIGLSEDDDPRLYSICSGKKDDEVWVLYNIKPLGKLTPILANIAGKDRIYVSMPFGSFNATIEPAYWIAVGTAVAPFISMLRSGMGARKTLIHGSRLLKSFYFEKDIQRILGKNYIQCCSQEEEEGVFHGRVTDYLRKQEDLPLDHYYYLCGSSEMVLQCRDILLEKGIPLKQIIGEFYQ